MSMASTGYNALGCVVFGIYLESFFAALGVFFLAEGLVCGILAASWSIRGE